MCKDLKRRLGRKEKNIWGFHIQITLKEINSDVCDMQLVHNTVQSRQVFTLW
jgi:hypothetical protein